MAATEMNFGPDWLRALQDGMPKSSNSNSSSSSLSNSIISNLNSKVGKHPSVKNRYSCEEMLMYYTRENCLPPKDLMEHEEVFIDKVQEPLLFSEPTIEEINLLSQSINSDYIVKKAAKENGDVNERANDYRERNDDRTKIIASGDIVTRKPPGMSGVNPGLNLIGMFSERGNGHPLRPGRGGNISERGSRTGLRNTGSLFARVSSYDETTTRSNTITSASLLNTKKGGLQRSSTENSSTSSTSITNMFAPAWRTSTTLTNTSNTTSTNSTNPIEPKTEWRSNSDASKNWRADNSSSSVTSSKTNANSTQKTPSKDFFDADDSNSWDAHAREYLNRKRGVNPVNKPTKPFNRDRRFEENNDLFKAKPSFEALDTFDTDDRDLFGGGRLPSSSISGYPSNYNDLFAGGNRGKQTQNSPTANRYNRDRGEYGQNDKWNNSHHGTKSYGTNDRENRYSHRYQQNQHYQRSNSHANEDEADRFGGSAGVFDEEDFRRNSLPEWSLEDPCTMDVTRVGTFDASGAFHEAIEEDNLEGPSGDKITDRKKEKQEFSKARHDDHSKTKEFTRSVERNGDASILKESTLTSARLSEESDRAIKQNTSVLHLDKPKIDYFNLTDPSVSPNSKPKRTDSIRNNTLSKDDHNFAQMEENAHHMLSKFDTDEDGDTTVLLSNQLSNLLKEESPISDQKSQSHSMNHHSIQSQLSQNDNLSFLQDRFQQSQSSVPQPQSSIFSSSLMGRIIGPEGKPTGPSSTENTSNDLLNQRLASSGSLSSHKNTSLSSILNENFGFNFASQSSVSSASEHVNSTTQSLFSSLSGKQTARQISSLSSFESVLGINQLESNDQINSTRLSLGILQQKQREPQEQSNSEPSTTVAAPSTNSESDANQWFYRDPQGTVQGPFTPNEMYDWFVNGYFSMDLLVRRGCDTGFSKLGDLYHACGRVPFFPVQSPFVQSEPNSASGSFLFGSSLLGNSNLSHSQPSPIGPPIVPASPSFIHQGQASPQLQPGVTLPQSSQSQNHHPFGAALDDLNKPTSNSLKLGSLFFNSQPPTIKDDNHSSASSGSSLMSMMQRQQSQQQNQPDSQIANLLGIGPQNTIQAQAQLRLILCQLMKNERFHHLTTAQQQQVVMEKFIQLNSQNQTNLATNQFQQPTPPPADQYLNHQTSPTRPTEPHTIESLQTSHPEEIDQQKKSKLMLEEQVDVAQESFEHHPPSHSLQHGQSQKNQLELNQQAPQSNLTQPQHSKSNPLQILQAAMAAATPNSGTSWENIVPGAMSLSAVEELQRREAEERYKQQQQKDEENEEFEHKVDRKRQSKGKQELSNKQQAKQDIVKQQALSQQPVQQSGKIQVIDSKIVVDDTDEIEHSLQEQLLQQAPIIPQMPQLPKKSVWGNPTLSTDPTVVTPSATMSIAEIQKLQEEKEREEEENRERTLQQQMASFIATQQQPTNRPGAPPLKWASQQWQEQNNSKIKTLAEIQAEEAEKAAVLRTQQESEVRRRVQANTTAASLSAIVAKSAGGSAWNNNNSQLFTSNVSTQKTTGSIWDEEENPLPASASAMASNSGSSAKNSANKSTKVDSAFLKQILKTDPKTVKKLEEAQLLKIAVESIDDLFRYAVDILNKAFDPVDAHGFVAILKELNSPNEVIEYVQSYLGSGQSAMNFTKFYVSKKSYLFNKSKQENAERAKQQQQAASKFVNQRQSGIWEDDEEDLLPANHRASSTNVTYKTALNQNLSAQASQKKVNSAQHQQQSKPKNPQQNQVKTKVVASTNIDNDVNIMNVPVESMEEFDNWCMEVIKQNFDQAIDVETFISFLKYLDSPFEINEYVQTYLGTSKASRDFSKNFITKRSYLRNKNKNEQHEDMCGPAPALNPSALSDNGFVTVSSSSKKKKKGRNNSSQQQTQQQPQTTIHTTTLD